MKCQILSISNTTYLKSGRPTHWKFVICHSSFVIPAPRQAGQALVSLLVFIAVALIVTTSAIAIAIINTQTTSSFSQGQQAYDLAESGAEDAILKLVRNSSFDSPSPGYTTTSGLNSSQVIVTPPGQSTTKTIVSRGVVNNRFKRKIQVVGQYNTDGTFFIVSWNEIDD